MAHHHLSVAFLAGDPGAQSIPLDGGFERRSDEMLSSLASALAAATPGGGWTLRVITGVGAEAERRCVDVCARAGLSCQIVDLEVSPASVSTAVVENIVSLPCSAAVDGETRHSMIEARNRFVVSLADLAILVGDFSGLREPDPAALMQLRLALESGVPVVLLPPAGDGAALLNPDALGYTDLRFLGDSAHGAEMIRRRAEAMGPETFPLLVSEVVTRRDVNENALVARAVGPETRLRRMAGRLDAVMTHLLWRGPGPEVRKALSRSPFVEYYGVSVDDLPEGLAAEHPVAEPALLRSRFAAFDKAANFYSGLHRDVQWLIYTLSAFAVFAAVAGALALGGPHADTYWAMSELVALGSIAHLVGTARRSRFHEFWLSSRLLAEMTRYARLTQPFLLFHLPQRHRVRRVDGHGHHADDGAVDEAGYLARLIVDAGPPRPGAGRIYAPVEHLDALRRYAVHIVEQQMHFHRKTAHRNHAVAHVLHTVTLGCFAASAIAIVGHFLVHTSLWLIFTGAFPAFAAALHGLTTQNEFERIALVSSATHRDLQELRDAMQAEADWTSLSLERQFLRLQALAGDAARVMSGSARTWREIIEVRSTGLPA